MDDAKLCFNLSVYNIATPQSHVAIPCLEEFNECVVIKRLLNSLTYYTHLLNTSKNNDHYAKFNHFMGTIYKNQALDDYYHLHKFHQDQIETIMGLAIKSYKLTDCKLSDCKCSDRHYRVNSTKVDSQSQLQCKITDNDEKAKFEWYQEVMDSLHFYIFHLFDAGLRIRSNDKAACDPSKDKNEEAIYRFSRFSDKKYEIFVNNYMSGDICDNTYCDMNRDLLKDNVSYN